MELYYRELLFAVWLTEQRSWTDHLLEVSLSHLFLLLCASEPLKSLKFGVLGLFRHKGNWAKIKRRQLERTRCLLSLGETIPIRLFLGGFDLTPTFRDVNMKFSTRYYLSLVLIDEGTLMWLHAPMMYLSPISLHLGAEPIACNLSHKCMRWCLSTFLTANFPLSNPSIAVGN